MTPPNANDDQRHAAALETVFQNLGDGILVLDREFHITLANKWIEKRYSGSDPLVGQTCYEALYGRKQTCPACPTARVLEKGKPQTQLAKIAAGPSKFLWFEISAYPLVVESEGTVGVVEQIRDVTRLKEAEDRLRDQAALRHIFVDQSRDGIVVLDPSGRILEANQRFAQMLGLTVDELRQTYVWDWDPQWDKERTLSMLERSEIRTENFEMRFQRKNATPIYVEIVSIGTTSGGEKLIYWSCRDVTDKQALQERIQELGIHDPLTGLYNRRYVLERLSEADAEYRRGGAEFCISIIDLDQFGKVNDQHGPKTADLALEEFAHTIGSSVRPYDVVGRFGGDEFIVVSKNTAQSETATMIRRIMGSIRGRDLSFKGHMVRLTFSCGMSCCGDFPGDSFSIDAMIARAYEHLEAAKSAGGDRFVSGLGPEAVGTGSAGV
jgi:diguanylate cyclase (GGDEF)-like protein/PAS domain S-box-containing protein